MYFLSVCKLIINLLNLFFGGLESFLCSSLVVVFQKSLFR